MEGELVRGKAAQQKARELLRELNVRMLPDGGEWAQLLDANVPAHTIESLYPFEMSDYAPYVVSWLTAPSRLEKAAGILGARQLDHSLRALPMEAYARSDKTAYLDDFFDGDDALQGLYISKPDETNFNGNAIFLMKQWGYLLLFLHEAAFCPSLPEHQCVEACLTQGAGQHSVEQEEVEFFEQRFEEILDVAQLMLAQMDEHVKTT